MDWLSPVVLNGCGAVGTALFFGILVVTGRLVPRNTHAATVKLLQDQHNVALVRAERWEAVALRALDATERLSEPLGVAAKVLTKLPQSQGGADE